jgi:hypothetical protein
MRLVPDVLSRYEQFDNKYLGIFANMGPRRKASGRLRTPDSRRWHTHAGSRIHIDDFHQRSYRRPRRCLNVVGSGSTLSASRAPLAANMS